MDLFWAKKKISPTKYLAENLERLVHESTPQEGFPEERASGDVFLALDVASMERKAYSPKVEKSYQTRRRLEDMQYVMCIVIVHLSRIKPPHASTGIKC